MAEIGKDIEKAVRTLCRLEPVAIPTETVYGLGANALEETAVARIYEVKNRPRHNPLIIHISSKTELTTYVKEVPPAAQRLADIFWPGPLTLLLPKKDTVPDCVTAGLPHVAVRVPNHPLTLALLRALPFPLAAPSANPFTYISPTTPQHVQCQIGDRISYILDGGPCQQGVESTIVGFEEGDPVVYRLGAITLEELERVVPDIKLHQKCGPVIKSPGMLPHHYSPATPLLLTAEVEQLAGLYDPRATGVILYRNKLSGIPAPQQVVLSPSGDLTLAARNLYGALHHLDSLGLNVIIAEQMPPNGLGQTINDRLQRASYKGAGPVIRGAAVPIEEDQSTPTPTIL